MFFPPLGNFEKSRRDIWDRQQRSFPFFSRIAQSQCTLVVKVSLPVFIYSSWYALNHHHLSLSLTHPHSHLRACRQGLALYECVCIWLGLHLWTHHYLGHPFVSTVFLWHHIIRFLFSCFLFLPFPFLFWEEGAGCSFAACYREDSFNDPYLSIRRTLPANFH